MIKGGRFYKKNEWNREIKKKDHMIVADTCLEKYDSSKHERYEAILYNGSMYLVKPKIFGFTVGYIALGNDRFVAVKKYGNLMIVLPLILLMIVFCTQIGNFGQNLSDIPIVGELIQNYTESQGEQEYMTIPGLKERYRLSSENREIYLVNPKGNTVYFKYMLYVNGEEILVTDYIEPDRMVRADLFALLNAGEYQLDVTIVTIDTKTHETCNGATLTTDVIIIKD